MSRTRSKEVVAWGGTGGGSKHAARPTWKIMKILVAEQKILYSPFMANSSVENRE